MNHLKNNSLSEALLNEAQFFRADLGPSGGKVRHDHGASLVFKAAPLADLRQGAKAAKAEAAGPINDTDLDAWRCNGTRRFVHDADLADFSALIKPIRKAATLPSRQGDGGRLWASHEHQSF